MKRIGKNKNIIEDIVAYENISNSIDAVLRGRRRKRTRTGRHILKHRDEIIAQLADEIRSGTFELGPYREKQVSDGPKVRTVQSVSMVKRIACHAIMNIVERNIFPRYIRTTAASIPNRGVHDLLKYIQKDMKLYPDEMKYFYQGDIRKFYESIDQDLMMECLRKIFKDPTLLTVLEKMVRMMPSGLSIGLRSSQGFGNVLLSMYLDHYIKDLYGVKHFYRYCDDLVVFGPSKDYLWKVRDIIHSRADSCGLSIKSSEQIRPVRLGLDFLGYVIYSDHTLLRKRNKKKAASRLHRIKSARRRQEITASLYGQCKHANCRNLFYRITGTTMEQYKRLSELGIKPKFNDGKKRFDCREIKLSELPENTEIVIIDFEEGMITKPLKEEYNRKVNEQKALLESYRLRGIPPPADFLYPDQIERPAGKYLVYGKMKTDFGQDQEVKFFTGDQENKSILDQLKEQGLLGMTICTIKTVRFKGLTRYILQ